MNALSKVTDAVLHPVQTTTPVASPALGITTTGVRTSARVIGWAVSQGRSALGDGAGPSAATNVPTAVDGTASSPTQEVSPTPETSPQSAVNATGTTAAAPT